MAWLLLVAAGLLEVVWALALKEAQGFTRPGAGALAITAAVTSFALLSAALRTLPIGTAYVAWVGIGAVGVTVAGILLLGENASAFKLLCATLIVLGVAGLHLSNA